LPEPTWLEGTDFKILVTDNNVIKSVFNDITNNNYLLTKETSGTNSVITLSNMDNFKFFGKKISDKDGNAKLNVAASGYLFFEDLIFNNQNYPLFTYTDNETSAQYKQVSTTDAIMFNSIINVTSYNGGFVKWVDREDEFIIQFSGKSTKFNTTISGKKFYNPIYTPPNPDNNTEENIDSFYAIRIDKKNWSIS
jgi:hypothetical protein